MMGKTFLMATTALIAAVSLTTPALSAASRTSTAAPAAMPAPPPPSVSTAEYDALKARVEQLEKDADAKKAADADTHTRLSTVEQNFGYAMWTYDNGRPTLASGDGRFSMSVRGRFQFDTADFMQDIKKYPTAQFKDLASGSVVRRAYFGVEGRTFKDFWYEFRMNFGGSNSEGADAAVNLARVAYLGIPNFRINVGVMQPIFTMSDSTSSSNLMFIERAEINNIAADSFGGSDSRRGLEMTFQKTDALMPGDNLMISGAYTGQKTGNNANNHGNDEGTQILGRTAYRFWSDGVFSNAQIGMSGAKIMSLTGGSGHPSPSRTIAFTDRPEIRIDGNQLVTTGLTDTTSATGVVTSQCNIAATGQLNKSFTCNAMTGGWLYGFEGGANFNNFYIGGEYYKFGSDRDNNYYQRNLTAAKYTALTASGSPEFSGWYVEGSWVLTGEAKVYQPNASNNEYSSWQAPNVIKPFSLDGDSWGAWELATRYSTIDLNWNAGKAGSVVPVGGIRGGEEKIWTIGLNWYLNKNVRVMFDDMIVNVDKLNASGSQQIGQKLNVVAARMQFSF